MNRRRRSLGGFVALALVLSGCVAGDGGVASSPVGSAGSSSTELTISSRPEWGVIFDDASVTGTFVLREVGADETFAWNAVRAAERRLPASTFKILNAMIILETGAIADVDTVVRWDGTEREISEWNRDHTLRSGIEVSAAWLFQELAREVGEADMAEWVARVGYGNADIGGGIDQFWLNGALRISPIEQLDFLEEMVQGDLPFRSEVVDAVRSIVVRETGQGWSWSHKTGTALAEEPTLGWLVGTTENGGRKWVYAMNVDVPGVGLDAGQIDPLLRQKITRDVLVSEGALPET